MKFLIISILIFFLSSCSSEKEDSSLIASYKDEKLFLSEIYSKISSDVKDTANFIDIYVDQWLRNHIILDKATLYIQDQDSDILEQVDNYKRMLTIYKYRKNLIDQEFDTTITKQEIQSYYEDTLLYKHDFHILAEDLVKVKLVVLKNRDISDLESLRSLILAGKGTSELDRLLEFCKLYSSDYFLDDSGWIPFSEIEYKLPDLDQNQYDNIFSKKEKIHIYTKENDIYMLFVKDYEIKGTKSPLSYVFNNIREVLRNTKEVIFIKEIENSYYKEAELSKDIKIY